MLPDASNEMYNADQLKIAGLKPDLSRIYHPQTSVFLAHFSLNSSIIEGHNAFEFGFPTICNTSSFVNLPSPALNLPKFFKSSFVLSSLNELQL